MEKVHVSAFTNSGDHPIIDVRSPAEYTKGHIPNSVNLPLFSNEERAIVGTIYKQKGQKEAIKRGLSLVGPKMVGFIETVERLGCQELNVNCWRGGMRSESMAWLFERYGLKTKILLGGYKAYRKEVLRFFARPLVLRVLTGFTGCQKTRILHEMANKGAQIIDLEGFANHQGSSFGNAKSTIQPTTEQFQNDLHQYTMKLDLHQSVWIEDESICIGNVSLPEALFKQMNKAPHVRINAPLEQRLDFLVSDYGKIEPEKLKTATQAIAKRLGNKNTLEALDALNKGQMKSAAAIILNYYDRQYEKSISKKSKQIVADFTMESGKVDELAKEIINNKLCR